jgi:hypothetical protein
MHKAVVCIASGRGREWEAFCLDFDLAVQGRSYDEARASLAHAIHMYVDAALAEPEPVRSRLLARRAPFLVRLTWAVRVFLSALAIRATHRGDSSATVEFIECPA